MRRRGKLLLAAVVLIAVLLGAVYSFFFYFGGLERAINGQIARMLGDTSPISVQVGQIKGNIVSGVILQDLIVRYSDSIYNYRVAVVPRVTVGYSFTNLWNRNYIFDYLHLDSARIRLVRDSAGQFILPLAVGGAEGKRTVEFSVDEFRLEKCLLEVISHEDTLEVRDIFLTTAVRSEGGTYAASIKQFSFDTNLDDVRLTAAGGKVTISDDNVYFQGLSVVSGDTRIKGDGTIELEDLTGQIEFAVDQIDLASIARHIGPRLNGVIDLNGSIGFDQEGVWGTVDIGGDFMIASLENLFLRFRYADKRLVFDTLYGAVLGYCTVDGKGEIDLTGKPEQYVFDADLKNFNLMNLSRGSFESDLSGRINLRGRSFKRDDMMLEIHTELSESWFDEYPIQSASGDIQITMDSLRFLDGFRVDYFENRFTVGGTIEYKDQMDLAVEVELDNLDRYRGKLFIDQPGGRGRAMARLRGMTADPNLSGRFVSDSLWLYGFYADTATADFEIDRFLNRRQGQVEVRFFDGSAWQIPYDTSFARLTLDSTVAFLDTVFIGNEYTRAVSRGSFDYGVYPQQLQLDSLNLSVLRRVYDNRSSIRVAVDSFGFDFTQASIGNDTASLSLLGRINYDETMAFGLSVDRVPIAPWRRLFDEEFPVDGYVSCEATVRGNFASPLIDYRGMIDSLTYRDLDLGDLTVSALYENRRLSIDSLRVDADSGAYRSSGYLPLDLAFTADSVDRVPDRPFDLRMTANDRRFDLLTLFLPSVEHLEGDFVANIRLSGTPSEPHLEGEASLADGVLKYYDLADSVFTDSAHLRMQDNRIIVDNVVAYAGERGGGRKKDEGSLAFINGDITVKALDNFYYNLEVTMSDEFPFKYDLDDIQGVVKDVRLGVRGDTPPLVSGDLDLVNLMYRVNFASPEEGSPIMAALSGENSWDLNLNATIPSSYFIKNDDIDAEFSGYINLIREDGRYRFIGEMEILRGRAFLFDKTFNIEPGGVVTFEDTEYPNPRLDIVACTRIPGVSFSEEEQRDVTELCIQVTGTLDNPEFDIAGSDTTLTREDILPLIVADYYGEGTSSSGQFEQRVTRLISSQVSRIGSRQLSHLGVETFEIEPAYGGTTDLSDTQVRLGKYFFGPNLYVYGQSTLSGQSGRAVGFEYRFSRSLILEGRRDEDEWYHLNFNLHLEY